MKVRRFRREECYDEESRLKKCCEELKRKLEQLNEAAADELREHLRAAVDNVVAGIRYSPPSPCPPRPTAPVQRH